MALKENVLPDAQVWQSLEKRASAVNALVELVDGPAPGKPYLIADEAAWVHTAFYTYRSGMDDNDPAMPRLARIEHNFIAALGALNFGDQMRQPRQALIAIHAFHRE